MDLNNCCLIDNCYKLLIKYQFLFCFRTCFSVTIILSPSAIFTNAGLQGVNTKGKHSFAGLDISVIYLLNSIWMHIFGTYLNAFNKTYYNHTSHL